MMKIVYRADDMKKTASALKAEGKTISFVPTMGFLHEGHLSLVREAKRNGDVTIVSIFVNPIQFAAGEDLEKYPRDFERDEKLLDTVGVDIIFYPSSAEIYPEGYQTYVSVEKLTKKLEGSTRPTHFRGVTTIVAILFNLVRADVAIFGQKDAQQAAVISRMVKDLHINTKIIIAPIVRDSDGLALSSRNVYLNHQEREDATILFRTLNYSEELIAAGERDTAKLKKLMVDSLKTVKSADPDYAEIVEFETFEENPLLKSGKKYILLIACKVSKTRLIDNRIISLS